MGNPHQPDPAHQPEPLHAPALTCPPCRTAMRIETIEAEHDCDCITFVCDACGTAARQTRAK